MRRPSTSSLNSSVWQCGEGTRLIKGHQKLGRVSVPKFGVAIELQQALRIHQFSQTHGDPISDTYESDFHP